MVEVASLKREKTVTYLPLLENSFNALILSLWQAWERGEKGAGFCWESPKERDHLEDQGVDGRMEVGWILGRLAGGGRWSGYICLRIGTVGRLL
jgi:hypothetical protein